MNLLTKQETQKTNLWLPGEVTVRDSGKVLDTLLYLKCITNKDLLYSTWNSSQCYVPAWMGEGFGGGWKRVCMAEPLCYSPETTKTWLNSKTK